MPARWREALDAVVDVLLPPACVACDEVLPGPVALCEACAVEVLELPDERCAVCSEPGLFPGGQCPRCRAGVPFVRAFAPFEHEGSIARAIHRFKYEDRSELGRPLGHLLASASAAAVAKMPGTLVPLPLHPARFQERRYDQAALLAAELSQRLGRPLEVEWLTRVRDTRRQVGLSEAEREANVAGAFAAPPQVRGQDVVLVDDVFTSGASAREAAGALRAAGASRVFVLTLARARSLLRSAGV